MKTSRLPTVRHACASFRSSAMIVVCLALSTLCGQAFALSYVMISDQGLVDEAPLMFRAQVVDVLNAEPGPAGIESRYALQVQEQFKGSALPAVVRLALPGGVLKSGIGQISYGIPQLRKDDTLLLFATRRSDGILQANQLTLGVFFQREHEGLRYFERALDNDDDHGNGTNARFHQPRDADRFEAWLRVAGRGVTQGEADYFLDAAKLTTASAKFNLMTGGNGNAVRWFQFDTNTALNWVSTAAGQTGMVQNEFTMLTQAANALTNDAGSKLTVTHSGGTIAAPDTHCNDGTSDGHAVLWNDPLSAIAGSFNCGTGGVLAVGGPCFFETATVSNGAPYNSAFEGRIQVQDGAGCYFDVDSGRNGAEVLLHEMGHVVGLSHSCGDASSGTCASATPAEQVATMRASAFGDSRGASLRPDDQAALAFVYPAAAGAVLIFANGFE